MGTITWRKASQSNEHGGDCVEVAHVPVDQWRKPSRSGEEGGNCIELAMLPEAIAMRDSKDPDGPKLLLDPAAFRALVDNLKQR